MHHLPLAAKPKTCRLIKLNRSREQKRSCPQRWATLHSFNCLLQKGTEFLSQDAQEHHCASSRGNMDKMVKSYDPRQFCVCIKKPNAVRALLTTYPNYLKIHKKKLEQTSNSVSPSQKLGWNPDVFTPFTSPGYMLISHTQYQECMFAFPQMCFPFLPLPCAIITEDVIQLGREEEKKEGKGGDLMCLYWLTSCCLLCWSPLLTKKKCLPLALHHIFSKLQNEC